jgi:uncharacterized protein YkwD
MNGVDLALGLIVLFFLWLGWQKGAIAGFSDLVIWLGSLLVGLSFYEPLSRILDQAFSSIGVWSKPLAFLLLIILSRIAFSFLFSTVLARVTPEVHSSLPNKALGLFPGLINGVLNAAIIAALLLIVPLSPDLSQTAAASSAAERLGGPLNWFNDKMAPIFSDALSKPSKNKKLYPKPDETINLPFTVKNAKPDMELERQMIVLVNEERTKEGLNALVFDPSLTPVARAHSDDMFERGYFSHYSPEGDAVSDRLKRAGITYRTAGENLALAPTLKTAHTGLMNSPGHRANILHKSYRRIGIGILDGGIRGLMVTQVFKN